MSRTVMHEHLNASSALVRFHEAQRPWFGYLGRLDVAGKGLDSMADGWRRYRAAGGRGTMFLAGPHSSTSGPWLSTVLENPDENVRYVGTIDGPAKFGFLREVDAMVLVSRHEGVPRVLREAIAVGTPLIVFRETNMAEMVLNCGLAGSPIRTLDRSQTPSTSLRARMRLAARVGAYTFSAPNWTGASSQSHT